MKVLLFNGSPKANGCTFTALSEVEKTLKGEKIDTEIIQLGSHPIQECIGCNSCKRTGKCIFKDMINEYTFKAKEADGFIFATPVYYAHPTGLLLSAMDRMFYSNGKNFAFKPAAVITSSRRAGNVTSMDAVMKHLTINCMPVVSSTYWNEVHGNTPDEVEKDEEGMQTMRNLARNMAWLLKCIDLGKKSNIKPSENEKQYHTNFIR